MHNSFLSEHSRLMSLSVFPDIDILPSPILHGYSAVLTANFNRFPSCVTLKWDKKTRNWSQIHLEGSEAS